MFPNPMMPNRTFVMRQVSGKGRRGTGGNSLSVAVTRNDLQIKHKKKASSTNLIGRKKAPPFPNPLLHPPSLKLWRTRRRRGRELLQVALESGQGIGVASDAKNLQAHDGGTQRGQVCGCRYCTGWTQDLPCRESHVTSARAGMQDQIERLDII